MGDFAPPNWQREYHVTLDRLLTRVSAPIILLCSLKAQTTVSPSFELLSMVSYSLPDLIHCSNLQYKTTISACLD